MPSNSASKDLVLWALASLPPAVVEERPALSVVAGDASSRRYFRLATDSSSYIVVEAPPATEKNAEFVAIRALLEHADIRVPMLHAADLQHGYLLLEDLGDQTLLPHLNDHSARRYYGTALQILHKLAAIKPADPAFPRYDAALLSEELGRFDEWFVQGLLQHSPDSSGRAAMSALSGNLIASALEQPEVLVHRDFHSRNLMLQPDEQLAVIDFQDAVIGPLTYDLVSLLRDCYIQWPADQVRGWALEYRYQLPAEVLAPGVSDDAFLQWFDWMGLQRHIKVLGTFARLYLRDGKTAYLQDLPLVLDYVREVLGVYRDQNAAFAGFADWFSQALEPAIAQQAWSAAP